MANRMAIANAPMARGDIFAGYDKPAALRGYASTGGAAGGVATAVFGPMNFLRQMGQGACAGLLTLLGATHLVEWYATEQQEPGEILTNLDAGSLQAIAQNLASGGVPGVLEIMGAIALFLGAGRGAGRVLGLMAFVAIAVAHVNGVTHEQFFESLTAFAEQANAYVQKFQASQNA